MSITEKHLCTQSICFWDYFIRTDSPKYNYQKSILKSHYISCTFNIQLIIAILNYHIIQSLSLILRYSWYILLTTMSVFITYTFNTLPPTLCSSRAPSSPPTSTSSLQLVQLPEFNCRPTAIRAKTEQLTASQSLEFWKHHNILSIFRGRVMGELAIQVKWVSQDEKVNIFLSVCLSWHVPSPKAVDTEYFKGQYAYVFK